MDIKNLKNKRQLNVQEQNALEKQRIFSEALYWRLNGIPIGLKKVLEEKGINTQSSIYLEYEQNFPGTCTDEGIILTSDKKFYKFELDLNENRTELITFYLLEDITSKIEIIKHKSGTGSTWGFLSLEVLFELNKC